MAEPKASIESPAPGKAALPAVWLFAVLLCLPCGKGAQGEPPPAGDQPGQTAKAQKASPAPGDSLDKPEQNSASPANGQPVLTGKSIVLPADMSEQQLEELLRVVGQQIRSAKAYVLLRGDQVPDLASEAAADFELAINYELATPSGKRILQIGIQLLETQPDRLFVQGYQIAGDKYEANPDINSGLEMVQAVLQDAAAQPQEMLPRDLPTWIYQLNYMEGDKALQTLRVMGYYVIDDPESFKYDQLIKRKNLPMVCKMPDPQKASLAGTAAIKKGAFGIRLPGEEVSEFTSSTSGGPLERLLISYDPSSSGRAALAHLLELLSGQIDVPARQLLIEGMVLEVSETGMKQLGLEHTWTGGGPNPTHSASFETASGETVRPLIFGLSYNISTPVMLRAIGTYRATLRALIREGKAQVLSRPSILALDNRQCRIRVTTEVPVSSTVITELTTNVKVQYISVGIVLNLRPRISSDSEDVSFQIDASVSDIDATSPYRIQIDPNSLAAQAQAPVVLTRQVQTYARIRNNTPLIIGGLISKRSSTESDRIPFISRIPIIGWLFKVKESSTERREVIIVLTPYVLPEKIAVNRAMPKDSALFDEIDPLLFRAIYRIRIQDVFDLSFLRSNAELNELMAQTRQLIRSRPELAERTPFDSVIQDQVPGETILVERMVYQIIKKLKLMNKVTPTNLILFKPNPAEPCGFEVEFLTKELCGRRKGNLDWYFRRHSKQALALTFQVPEQARAEDVLKQSIPEIRVLELKDRDEWAEKLYQLNQPVNGVPRWTILINSAKDIERLQAALILKRTVDLNKTDDGFRLKHFKVGRQLTFPVIDPKRTYLIDWEVARYFYHTEHYYAAFEKKLSETMAKLREAISRQLSLPGRVGRTMEFGAFEKP